MNVVKRIAAFCLLVLLCFPMTACGVGAATTSVSSSTVATSASSVDGTDEDTANETKSSQTTSANGMISTDDFEIRIVCGLDGNYRLGASIPVTIYIESLNEDFEGTVRMIVPKNADYGTEATAYEKDVMLTAGTQKLVTMSVYSSSTLASLKFQLDDAQGDTVVDTNVTMKGQTNNSALVGVLSDDYTALNYFDGQGIILDNYSGTVQLVELSEDILPEQSSGLEALSYLIINSYDTSKLSEDQYRAIKNWVKQGGVLIIGTGSDYRQTLSAFQDGFVNGAIGEAAEGVFCLAAEEKSGEELAFTKEQGVISLSLEDGEPLKDVLTDSNLIWDQEYGQGHVVVTAFNLGMEPISSWDRKADMGVALLQEAADGYSDTRIGNLNYGSYTTYVWTLSSALDSLHEVLYPNMKLMGILFLVFVILVGPGIYLILKVAGKREWMWVLTPVLAVVFTVVIFGINRDLRIEDPREASITTVYCDMDAQSVEQSVDMAIQIPDTSKEVIMLDSALSGLKLATDDSYYYTTSSIANTRYDYTTAISETSEGYRLTIKNQDTFDSTYMSLDYTSDQQSTEDENASDQNSESQDTSNNASDQNSESQDTSNNTSDQSSSGQSSSGQGIMEAYGLEVDIDRKTTGISGTVTNNTGKDLQWVSIYFKSRVIMIGDMKDGESVEVTEDDNKYFEYDLYSISIPGYTSYGVEFNKQNNIWNLFCERYLYTMDEGDVYVYASVASWEADYISDETVEEKNAAILVLHQTMGYSDYDGAMLLTLYNYVADYDYDTWDTDGQMYALSAEVEFDVPLSNVIALIRAKDSEAPSYYTTADTTIYGWNAETGQYDELFTDGETMTFEDGCPYINEGTIKLRFDCKTAYDDYSPQITVVGEE